MTSSPPRPEPAPAATPFPVFLDLAGVPVLVVGGGEVAVAKCRLLGRSGASLRAVDPEPCEELEELARAGAVELLRRPFAPADLDGVRLCYVGLDGEAESAAVVALARARGVLVNAVDRPALCDFSTPAIVERGPLAIAIGTGGAAPALARRVREKLEAEFDAAFADWVALLDEVRPEVIRDVPDAEVRRRLLDDFAGWPWLERVRTYGVEDARQRMREQIAAATRL